MTERRSRQGRPPTYLMQSYAEMTPAGKQALRVLGISIMLFTIGLPMGAQVALSILNRPGLPGLFWLFSGVGLVVGLSLVWPQLGIHMLSSLPRAVHGLLPSKWASMLRRPERRSDDD